MVIESNQKQNWKSWRGVYLFLGIYFGSLLFAAIVAPVVFKGVLWRHAVAPSELTAYLVDKGLDSFFDRIRWIPVLVGLPWALKVCQLFSLKRLGLRFDKASLRQGLRGLILGICVTVAMLVAVHNVYGLRVDSWPRVWTSVGIALLSGLILGFLEEIVFRGLLLKVFRDAVQPLFAITLTSLFFAYVHFKIPGYVAAEVTWTSGLEIAWGVIIGIFKTFQENWARESIHFLNLFLLSTLLCLSVIKWRTLLFAIGFHAGIVWILLIYKRSIDFVQQPNDFWLGSGGIHDGFFATMLFIALIVWLLKKAK
ncbi:MAG: hypothetical protein A2Y14_05705 [Verrucomicrobia bacterium GWF2_51_19]|nr:MAG: hypothetical protein A2Y14_05705 [Verrucomicrobia bacterium GWF2_51_19]HCJ12147.1 hypothetical protein [Opitutae bacterium]